jgi:chromosome segregation ATPase
MARPGVVYSEIARAATQLVAQGKNPTVEQVRLILGTGSSTTIANHLRQWKANQTSTTLISAKENIPNELIAILKGLWEKVIDHSHEQVKSIEAVHQQILSEAQEESDKYKANNKRWQKLYNQWFAKKTQADEEIARLQQALTNAQQENWLLKGKLDLLEQQLKERSHKNVKPQHLLTET